MLVKLEKDSKLFIGLRIETALRDALAQVKDSERHYFEDPNGPYLIIARFDRERWIGKIVDAGLAVQDVDDVQRNILSILRRIAPEVRHAPSGLKIFHLVEGGDDQAIDEEPDEPEREPMPAW